METNNVNVWFNCKVRYSKTIENGAEKKVTEEYLVEDFNFCSAENRIVEEMKPFISGEFEVSAMKKENYAEIFMSDKDEDDTWYKVKAKFVTIDEVSGKEKKTPFLYLVQSSSTANAIAFFKEKMKDTMSDYFISSVSETPIIDVYSYEITEK